MKDRAKTIRRVIEQGQMPPWFAAPVAEGAQNPWANDCSLSARDKADLLRAAWQPSELEFACEWLLLHKQPLNL